MNILNNSLEDSLEQLHAGFLTDTAATRIGA